MVSVFQAVGIFTYRLNFFVLYSHTFIVWGDFLKSTLLKYRGYLVFFLLFTLMFLVVKSFILYFLPFLIGIVVSFIMFPVYNFMKKRLSFKPSFSATVITLFIFMFLLIIAFFVCYLIIRESYNLYLNNRDFFDRYFNYIDYKSLMNNFDMFSGVFSRISDTAFSLVKIIPLSITLVLISFVSTVFFINNLPKIVYMINIRFSEKNSDTFCAVVDKSCDIMRKFIKSYIILYTLTFVESVFIFSLIGLDYVLVFAFLAAVSDLLPILGPGTVYLPIAVIKAVSGDYLSAITLVIFWAIVVIIRQIIEPKILSDNIKIHPLILFTALYFSVVSSKLWVLFYIMLLFITYKIFVEAGVFEPLVIKDRLNHKES